MAQTSFKTALTAWKEIDLVTLQKELDAQGLEIVENQKESMVGRKKLAEQTREFRKVPDEQKLEEFKVLLKAYQSEIDLLTKRSKFAENSFLNLYKKLAEAPDPHPLLDAVIDQTARLAEVTTLEEDNRRLKDELHKLSAENKDLQSKKINTTKLQAEVSKMETNILEAVKQRENELNAVNDEKIRNYEEREKNLMAQLEETRAQLKELKTSNEFAQAKLIDHNQKFDEEVVAKLAELDIVLSDLDRANSRVADMERRNELLRAEMETIRNGNEINQQMKLLENQVSDQEEEIKSLLETIEGYKSQVQLVNADQKKVVATLEKDVITRTRENEHLKEKLKTFADYDEIKRELEIIKFIEFRIGSDDDDDDEDEEDKESMSLPDPALRSVNNDKNRSLEKLLIRKNKKLSNDVTLLKVKHSETEAKLTKTLAEVDALKEDLVKQKSLNQRLEEDLLNINNPLATSSGSTSSSTTVTNTSLKNTQNHSTSSIALGEPLAHLNRTRSDTTSRSQSPSIADTSILPIITSQRDRFRQRNAELEEELRKQFDTISDLRIEIQTIQKENLQLYEKVRYMQTYNAVRGGSSSTETSAVPYQTQNTVAARSDPTAKYKTMYEDSMNPFEVFRNKEHSRAHSRLNPLERVVLGLVKIVLSNKYLRSVFIVYSVALHVLVVVTLYELSMVEPKRHEVLMPNEPR